MGTLNGSSLFSGITAGLTNTYSILANASAGKVTPSSISEAMNNSNYAQSLNPSFASYILSNFSSLDKDSNGSLSSGELSRVASMMTGAGFTSAQLTQLGTASGLSTKTLEQVLNHFSDIDTNNDGKVTIGEINAYNLTSAMEKKKLEYRNQFASDMSVFYGDSDSGEADSSSLISYKYLSDDNG